MSGMKKLVFNTQERAISPDVNRLQSFKEADVAELFRYALDVTGNDDLDAGSVIVEHTTVESPLRAEIINGLMVQPQGGALDLFVTPGVVYALSPDAAPDESNYKYVRDVGVNALGTLIMTANGGGSPRIDVIECRVHPVDLLVADNRDIFNPVTGLFTATSVTKERSARLEYRVRLGTVGGGFASVGTASGWLPLAVASVAAGSVSNDTITFWDVRPLISDREFQPSILTRSLPPSPPRSLVHTTTAGSSAADITIAGIVEGVSEGRRVGGRLRRGTPGTDAESIVLGTTTIANLAAGTVFAADQAWYLYMLTPASLPRWARYTDGPAGRAPRSPRGIPVFSTVAPFANGVPSAAIALPTSTGLSISTASGVCVLAGRAATAVLINVIESDGRWQFSIGSPISPTSADNTLARYSLVPGTHFPPQARELLIGTDITVAAGTYGERMFVYRNDDATVVYTEVNYGRRSVTAPLNDLSKFRIPVPSVYPSTTGPTIKLEHFYVSTGAVSSQSISVDGWRF